ncbi:2-aminomuconic 6-semialdehyde dehydrogenase [Acrasis kona]|uniref:2-aminomuconic 6-semialdehyde dehydrogenase n=1 Tax=Acrasis kona TaxID=1008807 RepID=A0AAW2YI07_9EUKA
MENIPANLPDSIDKLPENLDENIKVVRNYINGEWCHSNTGKYIVNNKPATGKVLSYIPRSDKHDVDRAIEAARVANKNKVWSGLPEEARASFLDKIADKIQERFEEAAQLESQDCGKPITTARSIDIDRAVKNFRFFAGAIRHQETGCHTLGTTAINYTVRRPIGVAVLITPWNLPLYLLSWKVAPALACGNCVVIKPSELTPMTANLLMEVVHELMLPPGVVNLVHGYGSEVGSALVSHQHVHLVSFTGGTKTGQHVNTLAANSFKKISLELGGKNSMIVFNDCDVEKAVQVAKRAGWANTGQVCLCCSRMLVQEDIYDRFVQLLTTQLQSMKIGDVSDSSTELGSLISQSHRAKVEYYVELSKTEGGKILHGGKRPAHLENTEFESGAFLEPTLIGELSPSSRTSTEEIFGPVVVIHRFKTEEEALEIANGVRYGLCSSVFTNDLKRAHRFSDELECGMVWVNTWLLRDLRVPFGGTKESGLGREGGKYSLEFYSEDKNVCISL